EHPPLLDAYVAGSDQVWNPYFTQMGEGRPTSTYFLDFGNENVKRIGYAVSFGCEIYPPLAESIAKTYIQSFDGISVREDSGLNIVENLGYNSAVKLLDPTLLLKYDSYKFSNTTLSNKEKYALVYILRNEDKNINRIISNYTKDYRIDVIN